MRIERLTYREHDTGWELKPTEFFPGVTLFVGASGVGKTRLLRAIHTLKTIAEATREEILFSGVEWDIHFSVGDGRQFHWAGQYSGIHDSMPTLVNGSNGNTWSSDPLPRILREHLSENGVTLIERDVNTIKFNGTPTPKLSPYSSCLSLLSHEESIAPACKGWAHMLRPTDDPEDTRSGYVREFSRYYEQLPTFEAIRDSTLRTQHKLALLYRNAPEVYQRILDQYRDIFPTVVALRFRMESRPAPVIIPGSLDYQDTRERPAIDLREKGNESWVRQEQISSGMWRTLMHLARMALWPDGTVVLIDEFENSLGINCLDMVTDSLNSNSRRLQFIITSHHPYVINNIAWKRWRIVTRNGTVVTTSSADELGFDVTSRHQAFLKLINMEAFCEGITAP